MTSPETGFYGLGTPLRDASIVYLPVPWDATTSYRPGAALGPEAMYEASYQLDFFDSEVLNPHHCGMAMLDVSKDMKKWNRTARAAAEKVMATIERTGTNAKAKKELKLVNDLSAKINEVVRIQSLKVMQDEKILGLIGGDHASPLGAFKAAGQTFGSFGILHLDAHLDLRDAYQGFKHSHASIMRNALQEVKELKTLVQVGIRDYSEEEWNYAQSQKDRVTVYLDQTLQNKKMGGIPWLKQCEEIVSHLPEKVWLSFDIDGLDPRFCPSTGTPVPGGLDFYEATALIAAVVKSKRTIIGFDLCEVAPPSSIKTDKKKANSEPTNEWDANVGMRLLYKMSSWTLVSQGKAKLR